MTSPSVDLNQLAAAQLLRRDIPPDEPVVKLRGVSTSSSLVIGSVVVDVGKFEVEVYESELAGIEALVETATAEDMRRVKAEFDHAMKQAQDPNGQPRPYVPSMAAAFREVMHRDQRPIAQLERVGGEKKSKAA